MRLKGFGLYVLCIFLCLFQLQAFGANTSKKQVTGPIITPINGLTVSSSPGQITITNSSGSDIKNVTSMLLSFSLDQTSISSVWGTPWLNWQTYTSSLSRLKSKKQISPVSYQYANQVNLPNNVFSAGSSITIQYTPQPYNNTAAPTNVQLFNISYPLNPATISWSAAYSGGVNTITITNTSGKSLNLNGAQLQMNYQGQIGSSIWGTPWANWSVTTGMPNYILSAGTSVQIPANTNLIVSFNGSNAPITNVSLWVQNATPAKGAMNINVPAAPALSLPNPSITVTGPSFPQGQGFTATWGQALPIANLQPGSYSLATPNISTAGQVYQASFSPNPVVVGGTTANVNLSYAVTALGGLNIQMPAAPAAGVTAPIITVQGPSFPTATPFQSSWASVLQICTNGASSCNGILPGNYTVSIPTIYSSTDAFTATGLSNPVVVVANQTISPNISYAPVPQGTFTVTINTPSLKKSSAKGQLSQQKSQIMKHAFAVTFTNTKGIVFSKNLAAGANSVSLPINDTYQITPPAVSGQTVTATPATVTVAQTGTPSVTIQYQVGAPTQFVVYYGGWEGDEFDLNSSLPANVTAVNLAFANITSALQVDTSVSGWLTNIPAPNVTMQPTYINWTVYKFNHPKVKILLSVGGSTFSAIWNSVLTASNADAIAQNIAAVVNQVYPAYKGSISSPANLLGNVTIDGVDLDVETGVRLSPTVSSNVALLVTSLKKYLNPGKLITFAAFSVGADPTNNNCPIPGSAGCCTVNGSVHCGEDVPLLQSVGNLLDWINVMAYDAGQVYATSLYQVALANYAQYMPASKILLGLDIQQQWDPTAFFTESAQQLATKAAWQRQHGYAGAMFWGVDVTNQPSLELQYVTAISAALN